MFIPCGKLLSQQLAIYFKLQTNFPDRVETFYLICLFWQPVPLDFAERYIKNEGDALLSVPNGRSWSAQFKIRTLRTGKHAAEIYGCWKDFAWDNNLQVGDVCIFELLDRTEISFQVSITRVVDDSYCQRSKG